MASRRPASRWAAGPPDADGRAATWARPCSRRALTGWFFTAAPTSPARFPTLPEVTVTFRVGGEARHHHVPLLLSPFAYSTYRGELAMAIVLGPNQYGKAETRVPRIQPDGSLHEIRDLNVSTSLRGDFADAHIRGDQAHVLPTDSQKNTFFAYAIEKGAGQIEDTRWPWRATSSATSSRSGRPGSRSRNTGGNEPAWPAPPIRTPSSAPGRTSGRRRWPCGARGPASRPGWCPA